MLTKQLYPMNVGNMDERFQFSAFLRTCASCRKLIVSGARQFFPYFFLLLNTVLLIILCSHLTYCFLLFFPDN